MSGLAAVLAGRHDRGVHTWHSGLHVPDVQHAVEHAGWRFGYVDGVALAEKEEVLRAIGDALDFAPHFRGKSIDGLNDCLRDVAEPTVLLWDGWGVFARESPRAFEKVRKVLTMRTEDAPPFEVLLRGPGPDDGIDSLD